MSMRGRGPLVLSAVSTVGAAVSLTVALHQTPEAATAPAPTTIASVFLVKRPAAMVPFAETVRAQMRVLPAPDPFSEVAWSDLPAVTVKAKVEAVPVAVAWPMGKTVEVRVTGTNWSGSADGAKPWGM